MKKLSIFLVVILIAAFVGEVFAALPQKHTATYEGYWGGLHAGTISLDLEDNGENYSSSIDMQSQGLFKFITGFKARFAASGKTNGQNVPQTLLYESSYKTSSKERARSWEWDKDGSRAVILKSEAADRVTEKDREDVIDPLTALLSIGPLLMDQQGDKVRLPVYDGKYRYDAIGKMQGPMQRTIGRQKQDVIHVKFLVDPVAGIKKRKLQAWRDMDIDLYLSPQIPYLPIQIVANSNAVALVITRAD